MFRPLLRSHRRPPRRGTAILITCFFLITIMMVTGLALVMYAAREKAAALAYQDAESLSPRVAPSPEGTVNAFLSALIYDTDDNSPGLQNSLRGHSIARGMYGSNPTGQASWLGSTTPWAGVGLFHEDSSTYTDGTNAYPALAALADPDRRRARLVNHTALVLNGRPFVIDPEWTGNRGAAAGGGLPDFAGSRAGKSYVGKHSGVVYPDLKSFFLAARDPYTGEVLQPSFHREWLFNTLAPSNLNWTNDTGKLFTLRPRPAEHPLFPRVPPDADGVYRGDVQNLPGGYLYVPPSGGNPGRFVAKNDSLWMHIGLAPIRLADGRLVQPMVAPLILPLDGSFDLSIHGNQLNAGAHEGYSGHGPWTVNINPGIAPSAPTERTALMTNRTASRNAEFNPFASGQRLPAYSGVAWNGSQVTFQLPTNNSMLGLPSSGDPAFTPAYGNFQNDNAQIAGHPAGYNSTEFAPRSSTASVPSPVYPYTDLKRFSLRYAFTPGWYNQAFAAQDAPMTFAPPKVTSQYEYLPSPGATTPPSTGKLSYRLDPAHAQRLLFTPRATGLDRPALAPNFVNRADGTALALSPLAATVPPPPVSATKPGPLFVAGTAYPSPLSQAPGAITDFALPATVTGGTAQQWYNALAVLGSVNLNRPLADYRTDITKPMIVLPLTDATKPVTHPANAVNLNTDVVNAALADKDRQALAKDIFARLIIATGAAAQVSFDPTNGIQIALPASPATATPYQITGVTATVGPEQYNALRYLAQLAVNIVDHIDNDDVSTVFQWNPTSPNDLPAGRAADVADAANRVVFGVEKPRVVLNEAYGEITNDQSDAIDGADMGGGMRAKPTGPANVRFWVELLNPTQTLSPGGVLGDGSVPLSAYTIQIRRETRKTGEMAANQDPNPAVTPGQNQEPFLFGATSSSNTSGAFDVTKGLPDATFELSKAAVAPGLLVPNDSVYSAPNLPAKGIILVGPPTPGKSDSEEFTPSGGVWTGMIQSPPLQAAKTATGGMGYTFPLPDANTTFSDVEFKRHIVLLRRAANPYLLPNDPAVGTYDNTQPINPYVTVDVMDYVPAFDAVHRGKEDGSNRNVRPGAPNGYDPVGQRFSIGKVQPLAGHASAKISNGAGNYNEYTFNTPVSPVDYSMVLPQKGAPSLPPAPMMPTPKPNEPGANTFGRHNGIAAAQPAGATVTNAGGVAATISDTIMLPFDWLPHLDRPLETAGDLFTVRDCKPHLLTSDFARNTATGLAYESSYAHWNQHNNGLARALELLSVKSPALAVAHGGRNSGKLNTNVIQDRRIVQGVWDAPATVTTGTRFDQTFVNNTVWEKLIGSRTLIQDRFGPDGSTALRVPVPNYRIDNSSGTPTFVPAPTVHETVNPSIAGDRPFQPYGTPAVVATGNFTYTNPSAASDGDTLLRIDQSTGAPYLSLTTESHAYTRIDPLRKVMNNLTTVSHSFVVYLTIGYFDVKLLSPGDAGYPTGYSSSVNGGLFPQFGAEVYDQIPGDMRQKFMAVIDMSNMALAPNTPAHASGQPFFTALAATARPVLNTATPPAPDLTAPVTLTLASGVGNGTTFSIRADGQTVTISSGDTIVLGYGSDAQTVAVQSVGTTGPTVNQITVTGLARPAWGGTVVSNVRPGYVGPQPGFNFNSPQYKPVVPYVERLR
ncbi:hypothetical protein R5W24_001428 [Gemmata sp. JC717]|uniref:hypothetical protein n=1 Tax=Gemmata algarum TaxID=2975278 RepID=UPI0021BB82E2|nr:hypothetical protein [Gemmata algarum]MDY3552346.1 hypothetical protein [Gemmata algarum]